VVDVVAAGGTVVVLDRENGAAEYADRLNDVLAARKADADLADAIDQRFRYHAWPQLKLEWGGSDDYPAAFAGVDLVIFDSSRKFLTSVGLKEDVSDDYSRFTEGLIDPLCRADIATLILDNTGHEDSERARGSSAKGDLADVTLTLKKLVPFSKTKRGRVDLAIKESRLGDIEGRWTLDLGGGAYGTWERPVSEREAFRRAVIAALRREQPLGRNRLLEAMREAGEKIRTEVAGEWLAEFAADSASGIVHTPAGYRLAGVSQAGTPSDTPPSGTPMSPAPFKKGRGRGHGCPGPRRRRAWGNPPTGRPRNAIYGADWEQAP